MVPMSSVVLRDRLHYKVVHTASGGVHVQHSDSHAFGVPASFIGLKVLCGASLDMHCDRLSELVAVPWQIMCSWKLP